MKGRTTCCAQASRSVIEDHTCWCEQIAAEGSVKRKGQQMCGSVSVPVCIVGEA